jgi:hypothetical protein
VPAFLANIRHGTGTATTPASVWQFLRQRAELAVVMHDPSPDHGQQARDVFNGLHRGAGLQPVKTPSREQRRLAAASGRLNQEHRGVLARCPDLPQPFAHKRALAQPRRHDLENHTPIGRDAWFASIDHRLGNHILRASYIKANDGTGDATAAVGGIGAPTPANSSQTGASQWIFGYGYVLSKRTELYAIYSRIRNDAAAAYDFATNTIGVAPGADPNCLWCRHQAHVLRCRKINAVA